MNGILFTLTATFSLALPLLVSIYNKADGFYGWLCGKVHAYKVGPDSDNIQILCKLKCDLLQYIEYDEFDLL